MFMYYEIILYAGEIAEFLDLNHFKSWTKCIIS
jgi:hypothetical protein